MSGHTGQQQQQQQQQQNIALALRPPHRLPDGHEPVAHPPPRGPVAADVGEPPLVVAVGGAEGDLLDGLVHDEPLGLVVHNPEAVAVHVQDGADGLALRTLK